MPTVTAANVKAQLDAIIWTGTENPVRINDYVEKNESHRKYPSIDIQNITGQENIEGLPTTEIKQVYLVHLYWKTKGTGAAQEPKIKTAEDLIFNKLDAWKSPDTEYIQIVQSWDRKSEIFPVSRVHSTLRVSYDAIESTDGNGIPGSDVTIDFPGAIGELSVLNLIADEQSIVEDLDITIDPKEIFTRIHNAGILSVEVATTKTNIDLLKAQVQSGSSSGTVTISYAGSDSIYTVNYVSVVTSGPRTEVLKTIVTMNVIYS